MAMLALPSEEEEVISVTPGIWPRRFSSGAASEAEAVAGSTPGWLTPTETKGNSTFGSGATGRKW